MAAQLRHLLTLTTSPAVTVQVGLPGPDLPAHDPQLRGSSEPDVACHVGIRSQMTISARDADLRAVHAPFTALAGTAASPGDAATLISNALAYWERQALHARQDAAAVSVPGRVHADLMDESSAAGRESRGEP